MFEDATFHSRGTVPSQTPKWMLLTCAVNCAGVAALILLPLLYPGSLPSQFLHRILCAPPPPAVPVVNRSIQPTQASQRAIANPFIAPTVIPTESSSTQDQAPASVSIDLASPGVPYSTVPATTIFHTTPPPVVKPAPPHTVTVSRGVSEGLLISRTNPTYPVIARSAHVSGTVILAATISTEGRIENLRIISGHPMLRQAAIDAVKTWRYRPYQLNNQPVEVETTININFTLGSF
jgi:periplasmic protein TonB